MTARRDLQIGEAIRRCFADGNRMIIISVVDRGFQVSVKRPDGMAFGVEIGDDVIETIYCATVPFSSRRTTPIDDVDDDLFKPPRK